MIRVDVWRTVVTQSSFYSLQLVSSPLIRETLQFGMLEFLKPSWKIFRRFNSQRGWYTTEEEYYLLLFSVAVCGLRFISFSLEHCWSPLDRSRVVQLFWLFSYTFYHPFFYNGPIITFKAYTEQVRVKLPPIIWLLSLHWQMRRSAEGNNREEFVLGYALARSGRVLLWWCLAEYMIHVMYMHSIQSNETYMEILPPWALGGLALALVQFFYVKYLVLFGFPSMLATLDGLVPPKLPRCVSIMYSFTGMWR
ncbi:hypothetical protein XENOCAPTIV_019344 [Xenoophorus captivus]|uniref:Uncharacterized protein n=1 Tax=Xenoophorus captivus TaxID=1517983 RepID=A0ABV0R3M8_9TELE